MAAELASCVIAGGNGQVGRLFATHLAATGAEVTSVDIVPAALEGGACVTFARGDITAPSGRVAEAVARADVVLLAVPESVALAAVVPLAATMQPGALLVDTLSVKSRISPLLLREMRNLEALSLNPMFAPGLGMAGRAVAVVRFGDGPRSRAFLDLLRSWGARVVLLEADRHDHLTAITQAATHAAVLAFGLALREWGVEVAELRSVAPPPHLFLLALLARITSGPPEVYWDVQAGNPRAIAARNALRRGFDRLEQSAGGDSELGFASLLSELREFIGGDRGELAALCSRLFAAMPQDPASV